MSPPAAAGSGPRSGAPARPGVEFRAGPASVPAGARDVTLAGTRTRVGNRSLTGPPAASRNSRPEPPDGYGRGTAPKEVTP
ncbi:hypothetical protein L1I79_33810 [Strepomyces sp. STD 3.1]|uniref:hypothetical protein n=1 Tax=Streptomyces sp. NPDC058985 TaxID=3346684 RepID=UPI001F296DE2|nr:hypothetical protein [Streptomyces sp. STD 3.1]